MGKTYVGFGFGPIQSALFLYEAYQSGRFSRYVVSEVDASLVAAVRANGGGYAINIAHPDRVDRATVRGIEIYDPNAPADREALVAAIAESDEMATALPSVGIYTAGNGTSVVKLLCAGLGRRASPRPTVVYTAENHNHAAEILAGHLSAAGCRNLKDVQLLNTVIGKMSGVISEEAVIARLGLTTTTPGLRRAVLVEAFNRILVTRISLPGYKRGIEVFVEKPDLLPFEEAKLYGHNAIHAVIAYLADLKGLDTIAEAGRDGQIMDVARKAFIDESGEALLRRHQKVGDPLFTPEGYRQYADDLLARMVNPNLNDLVVRVGRDHVRKLGYDDRLYGTMRLALEYGVQPCNLALGAAAGIVCMMRRRENISPPPAALPAKFGDLTQESLGGLLEEVWQGKKDRHAGTLVDLTWNALHALHSRVMAGQ
ncbi:MAG: hypothetical protein NTW87_34340 [Planctomycetota bacterium]|nr:hypothetical protein [Planctomycetota bacterium]